MLSKTPFIMVQHLYSDLCILIIVHCFYYFLQSLQFSLSGNDFFNDQ